MKPTNKLMKRLFLYLFLVLFSFQTVSWADDIRDFQIEGMSIGDSLLDYFSKSKIKNSEEEYYSNNEFIPVYIEDESKFIDYSGVQFHYKRSDKNFKIAGIEGILWFKNNIDACYKKMKELDKELKNLFSKTERVSKENKSHAQDKSGKSKYTSIDYFLESGDAFNITCTDWTTEMGYPDNLRIALYTEEFLTWIDTKAYK